MQHKAAFPRLICAQNADVKHVAGAIHLDKHVLILSRA
jgi:hypothetical protein